MATVSFGSAACLLFFLSCSTDAAPKFGSRGPAYDYIYRPDPNYSWEVIGQVAQEGYTAYVVNMTSQMWFDDEFTNRPIWWHNLLILVPDVIKHPRAGSLYISSRNNNSPPDLNRDHVRRMGTMAAERGYVTAVIEMVPNQPITFETGSGGLYEDAIIAFTWRRFLNLSRAGDDPPSELPLHLPMAKASVRAMDTMSALVESQGLEPIDQYFVAGQSKRGWTTWIVGAVDERVIGMAPTVLSCLNLAENFHHYWKSFGGWPFVLRDYWNQGIMGLLDEPETKELEAVTDPYAYRQWMTMPKLLVNGASDEFFLLDDFDYFYDDLPGESHIWILENHGHSINSGPLTDQYWAMLGTFTVSLLQHTERPSYEYWRNTTADGGSITVRSPSTPLTIAVFSAPGVVPHRRDFRLRQLGAGGGVEDTGIVWEESNVEDLGDGMYKATFDNPEEGYLAFFIKISYSTLEDDVFTVTTKAHILPEGFPYEDCVGEGCQGLLV